MVCGGLSKEGLDPLVPGMGTITKKSKWKFHREIDVKGGLAYMSDYELLMVVLSIIGIIVLILIAYIDHTKK